MQHASSNTKETYAISLLALCDDTTVAASWLRDEPEAVPKIRALLEGQDEELCLNALSLLALLAACPDNALELMATKNLTAQVCSNGKRTCMLCMRPLAPNCVGIAWVLGGDLALIH